MAFCRTRLNVITSGNYVWCSCWYLFCFAVCWTMTWSQKCEYLDQLQFASCWPMTWSYVNLNIWTTNAHVECFGQLLLLAGDLFGQLLIGHIVNWDLIAQQQDLIRSLSTMLHQCQIHRLSSETICILQVPAGCKKKLEFYHNQPN